MVGKLNWASAKIKRFKRSFTAERVDKLKCVLFAAAAGLTPIGGLYPFGWAFFISCDRYRGATLSTLMLCSFVNGDPATGAVLGAGLYAFKKLTRPAGGRPLSKAAAALCAALFLCVTRLEGGIYGVASSVVCSAVLPLFTVLYSLYRTQKRGSAAHFASVASYLFTSVAFLDKAFPYPAPGRTAALTLTLLAAREGGMLYGGTLGFLCGLACDSATGAMLGVCGFTGGLLFTASEYAALPVGCLAGLCTGMYFLGTASVPSLILCHAAAVLLYFGLKNRTRLLYMPGSPTVQRPRKTAGLPLSEAFFAISQSARMAAGGGNGAVRAADDYASFSSLLSDASEREEAEEKTDAELSEAAGALLHGAGVRAENVRVSGVRKKCLEAENVVIDALKLSSDDLSGLVSKLTGTKMRQPVFYLKDGRAALHMESAPLFRIECSRTGVCKRGERVSGDTVSFFRGKDGLFFALISDGMGSGDEAAVSSRTARVFLEKLLAAGAGRQNAISLLNSYLSSREKEVFATVDLFEADLYTGRGVLVKAGAAPSFVMRGGKCRKLQSATAPAGIIRELHAEQLSFPLMNGDLLVMLSDGLAGDGGGEEAERALCALPRGASTAEIANALMEDAVKRTNRQDDLSVCVIKILSAA